MTLIDYIMKVLIFLLILMCIFPQMNYLYPLLLAFHNPCITHIHIFPPVINNPILLMHFLQIYKFMNSLVC
ncbi:hypothetical protein GLOIN_2v1734764 [Rhizophagus irregularis DAOM 181602=DAOM 197198]|uniref:Uncharacterized protein n=1 Tax=Rhizophagus irregularis (strain DAOM 181602 / DAOM 197198 / MUCL 43194) TaxID=747089 RepID=A0A2P4NXW6_RHIID|nr:hypothetical protein GLOIN_2v1734764 [Rhizophagus irregularis DAOM 181602=DAOM 197198]POG57979.1 hypothetical protein GLOIN_2v1734764 [Rhizophagus irregularis DAOM 181602=DAOM 197198]|eukprot:XP_025164845.1 hypothetical protein GLOIN_2v1734764 [Rhizophagus irregularis DAOM 181602=DAOM 197198]